MKTRELQLRRKYNPLPIYGGGQHKIQTTKRKIYLGDTIALEAKLEKLK